MDFVVYSTISGALFIFLSYRIGYRNGAKRVLREWKAWIQEVDQDDCPHGYPWDDCPDCRH